MTQQVESIEVHSARRGYGLHKWVNNKTPGDAAVVLTDATLYYDIPEGRQVLITTFSLDQISTEDTCYANLVSCSDVAGGGDATDISGHFRIYVDDDVVFSACLERFFNPPILVRYSDGARSISIKVDANDADAIISCGWCGWVEDDLGD